MLKVIKSKPLPNPLFELDFNKAQWKAVPYIYKTIYTVSIEYQFVSPFFSVLYNYQSCNEWEELA